MFLGKTGNPQLCGNQLAMEPAGARPASSSRPGRRKLPLKARDALAGVAARIARKLTLERSHEREAVAPFYFGGGRGESLVGRLGRTVHDKARARQGLESGGDRAIGIVVVRPGKTPAQAEDRIRHRPGFVGAHTDFAAGIGYGLGVV